MTDIITQHEDAAKERKLLARRLSAWLEREGMHLPDYIVNDLIRAISIIENAERYPAPLPRADIQERCMNDLSTFLERYEKQRQFWPATPQSQVEAQARTMLAEAAMHIKWLQERAGAMTQGESFNDIAARVGRQPKQES